MDPLFLKKLLENQNLQNNPNQDLNAQPNQNLNQNPNLQFDQIQPYKVGGASEKKFPFGVSKFNVNDMVYSQPVYNAPPPERFIPPMRRPQPPMRRPEPPMKIGPVLPPIKGGPVRPPNFGNIKKTLIGK